MSERRNELSRSQVESTSGYFQSAQVVESPASIKQAKSSEQRDLQKVTITLPNAYKLTLEGALSFECIVKLCNQLEGESDVYPK